MLFSLIWLLPQVYYNNKKGQCVGISFFWIFFNTIGDTLNLVGTVSRQHWVQWIYQAAVLIPETILLFQFIYYRIVKPLRNDHEPLNDDHEPLNNDHEPLNPGNADPPIQPGLPMQVILLGLVGLPYLMGTQDSSSEKFSYEHRRLIYEGENEPMSSEITDYIIAGIMGFFYTASKLFQFPVNSKHQDAIQKSFVIYVFYLSLLGHLTREIGTILLYDQDINNKFLIGWSFVWFFYNLVCLVLDGLLIAQYYYYIWQSRQGANQQGIRRVFQVFCRAID
uniref:Uncharacterized protein n=1 Tax=Acrobeloides nanus TaxID=290746 RepID=A0A914DFD5_9BILA